MIEFFKRKELKIPPERLAKEQERMRIESERMAEKKALRDKERAAAQATETEAHRLKEKARLERLRNLTPERAAQLKQENEALEERKKRIVPFIGTTDRHSDDRKKIDELDRRIEANNRELRGEEPKP
ncbi:MAG: hypothetical protein AAB539_01285 [Patescibacteria group bacterium]